jgi:hypothetical protein
VIGAVDIETVEDPDDDRDHEEQKCGDEIPARRGPVLRIHGLPPDWFRQADDTAASRAMSGEHAASYAVPKAPGR